jgi:hypothetical protein
MSDDALPITDLQRSRLLDFITEVDQVIGDGTFNPRDELSDYEIVLLSITATHFVGVPPERVGTFFHDQFGMVIVNQDAFDQLLAIVMLDNVQSRIKAAAGGRN